MRKEKLVASPFAGYAITAARVQVDGFLFRVGILSFRNMNCQYSVLVARLNAILPHGARRIE